MRRSRDVACLAMATANDIKDELMVILNNIDFALPALPMGGPTMAYLVKVDNAGWRCADLVRGLLLLGRFSGSGRSMCR